MKKNNQKSSIVLNNNKENMHVVKQKHTGKKNTAKAKTYSLSSLFLIGVAVATVFLSSMPTASEDVIGKEEFVEPQTAIEYVVNLDDINTSVATDSEEKAEKSKRSRFWSLISVPLSLLAGIIGFLLKPIIGKVLAFIFFAVACLIILCLCLKIINPDMSLKEMLTPKNIVTWFCSVAVFALALNVPEIIDPKADYPMIYNYISVVICTLSMVLICTKKKTEEVEDF